jgi:HPt (histidine-containing phosphotransfer) domain-containing protein
MLVKDIAEELDRLDQAVCRGDRPDVEDATHTMKGLCGHLRLQAAWLNSHAATASIQELKDAVDSLRAACSVFLQAKPRLEEMP